ncbi:Tll0287-like domain-containing protein [Dichotomicrobium thermohalophilum]|uniref:Uncharacterized protein DUF3365 n=1 Tax=Dichotomicrobium thermohalophilum TaxID=933063 RepID=A0A397PJ47_9HYPH|nr:DUF3365 domain-containing protein [Dichotomicrobium thermohalophilum]RIA47305.1 uncharacterized protein DUF3365 [Dichotomicrobium thermohalophilum]
MKKLIVAVLASSALAAPAAAETGKVDTEAYVAEANAIIKDFMTNLKGELKRALKNEGPVGAIGVCQEAAPAVTRDVAAKHDWDVGRTALRLRNQDNAPDEWERKVLEDFIAQREEGADPKTLSVTKVVSSDGETTFRYMKAIPLAEKPCATCHGTNVDPDLRAEILKRYPQDEAVGFEAGEIRGAFTLSRKIN